jgi:hypothetical protein
VRVCFWSECPPHLVIISGLGVVVLSISRNFVVKTDENGQYRYRCTSNWNNNTTGKVFFVVFHNLLGDDNYNHYYNYNNHDDDSNNYYYYNNCGGYNG